MVGSARLVARKAKVKMSWSCILRCEFGFLSVLFCGEVLLLDVVPMCSRVVLKCRK